MSSVRPNSYNISEEQKNEIREMHKNGVNLKELCSIFKVSKTRIIKILNEKNFIRI